MTISNLGSCNYRVAFEQITHVLIDNQSIWRHKPFVEDTLPWQRDPQYSGLYQRLLSLSDVQLQRFSDESLLVAWLGDYLPDLAKVFQWQLPESQSPPVLLDKFADVGIPGRKKQQIEHFVGAFKPFYLQGSTQHHGKVVDWCCGKGYMTNHLHRKLNEATLGLEFNPQLVADARQGAAKLGLSSEYACVDVLASLEPTLFTDVSWHSALHACGDLHVRLLHQAVDLGHGLAVSPCCYHLISHEQYQPLSSLGQAAGLQLSKDDLRLSVLQSVTGGKRVRKLRVIETLWRKAFDLWYRDYCDLDGYTHTKSVAKHWFSGSFTGFCEFMAAELNTSLPEDFVPDVWLNKAEQAMGRVKRLELARLGFRPVLELWLLLDRVLFLQQHDYEVELIRFCRPELTPRNGMIIARPKTSS